MDSDDGRAILLPLLGGFCVNMYAWFVGATNVAVEFIGKAEIEALWGPEPCSINRTKQEGYTEAVTTVTRAGAQQKRHVNGGLHMCVCIRCHRPRYHRWTARSPCYLAGSSVMIASEAPVELDPPLYFVSTDREDTTARWN